MTSETVIPTCYRHPDRETRLACSNCDRPVCVDCVRSASVGQRCLECAAPPEHQQVMDMSDVNRVANRATPVARIILVATIGVFVLELLLPELARTLRQGGAQINPAVAEGEWYRAISAAFLHGGITHIGFNMYALYLFGPQLEREVGSLPFAALYVAAALGGGAAFFLLEPNGQAVGASGAIFGLFGAWLAASYRGRHTTAGRASLNQLLMLLGINAAIGFMPGFNIAWQAHLGGLIAGFAIAMVWALRPLQHNQGLRTLAAAGVGVLALVFLLL